ncbi:hypothetical protein [Undibacterium sp. Ji22W]|uniref:hypothetical protein n=1 Tax=Undibacterium sp. Ji22W TaxID=3413038 RepID=UPI003BF27E99
MRHNKLTKKCLSFAIVCFFFSANISASTAYDLILNQLDFSKPIRIEFNLVPEKYTQGLKLCQIKSPHKFECTINFSISPSKKEHSEVHFKMQSNFTRAALEELIQTTQKEFETYGKFSVTLQQETSAK